MSAYERKMKQAAWTKLLAGSAAGIGQGSPMGAWAQNQADMAAALGEAAAQEELADEMEKKQKSEGLGKLGSLVGGVAGAFLPVVGPIAGPAIGSALGGTAGQIAGGGKPDVGTVLGYGARGAIGGLAGQMLAPGMQAAGAGGDVAAKTGNEAATAGAGDVNNMAYQMQAAGGQSPPLVPAAGSVAPGQVAAGPTGGGGFLSGIAQDPRFYPAVMGQMGIHGMAPTVPSQAPRMKYVPGYGWMPDYGYRQSQVG